MPYEHKTIWRVQFSETDMAGIVHFSNFFKYMEFAEHDFFRTLGFSIVTRQVDPPVGWPRVHASCDYRKPLRFEDKLEIQLLIKELRTRSIRYLFKFRRIEPGSPELLAQGEMAVACVTRNGETMKAVSIPQELLAHLQVAPSQILVEND